MWSGASPIVPSTSSWPLWPMRTIVYPSPANLTASRWTFVTSGHVASIVRSSRAAAFAWTAGETPWAEKTTVEPSGTSVSLLDEDRAALAQLSTTCLLCTISLRT